MPDCDFFHKLCKQNTYNQLKYNSLYFVKKTKDEYIYDQPGELMHKKYMHHLKTHLLINKDLGGIYGM